MRALIALLFLAGALRAQPWSDVTIAQPAAAVAGGGGGAAFSDDFNRADGDSLGANWTEAAGDADIASNHYRISTGSFGMVTSVHNTATGTTTQYIKVSSGPDFQYPHLVLRYVDSSSGYYTLQIDGNTGGVEWYYFANAADTSGDLIGSGSLGAAVTSATIGATITGTGTSTVVMMWRNPTGLPSTSANWNGDTTPEVTLTDNPATPCDTGQKVGLGGQVGTADLTYFDDFYGGGL